MVITTKIRRKMIINYHKGLRKTPYDANRRIAVLRVILQKALDLEHVTINNADRIKKFKEKKHKLMLTVDTLFQELYPVAAPMLKRAIMLAFHLVQHENEVKRLQWTNFDLENNIVSFTRSKTDEDITIDFSENPTLISYLKHLKSTRRELSPYLVCHKSPKGWVSYQHFRSMLIYALSLPVFFLR